MKIKAKKFQEMVSNSGSYDDEPSMTQFYGKVSKQSHNQIKQLSMRYGLKVASLYGMLVEAALKEFTEDE